PKYRWRFRDLEEADNVYASVLSHADNRIGTVLEALDRLQLTENTLVIFSSDNGPARAARPTKLTLMHDTATGAGYGIGAAKGVTGGRRGYKAALFEGGIGTPFIARWPGKIPAGKVDKTSLLSAVDLLPTFCEIAGVTLPPAYKPDGLSQVAALKGEAQAKRKKPLFWKMQAGWPPNKTRPNHWVAYAMVDQNWKLVSNNDASHWELFDITLDPYEKRDLKDQHPKVVQQLLGKLDTWKKT
ncbi:MAG: sulfatase-like hydrolase/transferase, partial [Verrucomicrobiales bacterium]